MCIRSHSHDGTCRIVSADGWTQSRCSAPGPGRALAVPVHEHPEPRERLLAGHLLLDDRGGQRLHHQAGAADPPLPVAAPGLLDDGVPRLEPGRGRPRRRAAPGTRLERPVGARPPGLRPDDALARARLDDERGRARRRTDAAPVLVADDLVRRVAAAALVGAERGADRARPVGSPLPHPSSVHAPTLADAPDSGTRSSLGAMTLQIDDRNRVRTSPSTGPRRSTPSTRRSTTRPPRRCSRRPRTRAWRSCC